MKAFFLSAIFLAITLLTLAQDAASPKHRSLTVAEYEKAKTYVISDLDKDTYAKFDNAYILDRYEMRKPYFVTGEDGQKKRIDLYKLLLKDGMQELGTMIFYTTEKGKVYTALQPAFNADTAVWNRYFKDIDDINKEEKNFVLKLSYVISRELSFQLYKAMNQGKDMKDEMATYGTDICFPGDDEVTMADGSVKQINHVQPGEHIIAVDPVSKKVSEVTVTKLVQHEAKNYAITSLLLVAAGEQQYDDRIEIRLSGKILSATPNHPITTLHAIKKIGDVQIGDEVICLDENTNSYKTYKVYNKTEAAGGLQKVYNLEVNSGSTLIMNGVMVNQK